MKFILCFIALCIFNNIFAAQENILSDIALPESIETKLPNNWNVIDKAIGNLNNDKKKDYLIVLENKKDEDIPRKLLVFTSDESGNYKISGESDKIILCKKCGGAFGDPHEGILIKNKKIIVINYGGSNFRWGNNYTFSWSKIDSKWQLILWKIDSYHTSAPDEIKIIKKSPRIFGKISLEEFNPDNF